MNKIKTALISVWDKTNIIELAKFLKKIMLKLYLQEELKKY